MRSYQYRDPRDKDKTVLFFIMGYAHSKMTLILQQGPVFFAVHQEHDQ